MVPKLACEGVYLASESPFSRVSQTAGRTHHRGRAKTLRPVHPPTTPIATGPRQGVVLGHPYLPAEVTGR
jgi:hypothetical protein